MRVIWFSIFYFKK